MKKANSVNGTTNLVQEMHEKHLRISFITISRTAALSRLAKFHNDQVWHDMSCALIRAGVDLANVVLLGSFTEGHEIERFRIQIRISPQNIEDKARGWTIVTRTNNYSIANKEQQLAFVFILDLSEEVDDLAQGSTTFSVTRHLTDDELVMVFRSACRTKVWKRGI